MNIVTYYVLLHILSFLLYSVFKVHTCGGRFALFVRLSCSLLCLVFRTFSYGSLRWAFRTVCTTLFATTGLFWLLAGLPPVQPVVGSNGLEPSTSRLSGVRSNHLSYEPMFVAVPVAILRPTFVCFRLSLYSFRDLKPYGLYCLKRVVRGAAVVEMNRIELSTPCLQGRCSPS